MILTAIVGAIGKMAGSVAGPAIQSWVKGKADEALAKQQLALAKLQGAQQV